MSNHPFPYLADTARKYGKDEIQVVAQQQRIIDLLTDEDLAELARTYEEIEQREDAYALSRWIEVEDDDGMKRERRQALMLMFLFGGLARSGMEPFVNRRGGLQPRARPPLDWSKLPDDLRYLAEPAEKYGKYQFEEEICAFLERMTADEEDELRALDRLARRDYDSINAFIRGHRITEHEESCLVYFLIGLLDGMGFDEEG